MFIELGRNAWVVAMAQASAYFDPRHDRGMILSPHPETLNPKAMEIAVCIDLAPREFAELLRCRMAPRLLDLTYKFLAIHCPAFQSAWEKSLSADGAGLEDKRKAPFDLGRAMLWRADHLGETKDSAVLSALAYALIGLGIRHRRHVDPYAGCSICWFRNRVPGSRFCCFHQYSHQHKGQENRYALRQRVKRLKTFYFPREGAWRNWFRYYMVGLSPPREEWGPVIKAYVVSKMSVTWLEAILADCPNVRGEVGESVSRLLACRDWEALFETLRRHFDHWDTVTNLDFWCAKLLQAEAWLDTEREVAGRWLDQPVIGEDGRVLRSGQHVDGKRGPKQATLMLMEQAIEAARSGCHRERIADTLGIKLQTLVQWEKRHPNFGHRLRFELLPRPLPPEQ